MGNSILRRGIFYLQQRNKMFLHLGFKEFFSLHIVLFWHFYMGRYHYPRRAFHAAKTLGAQRSRWRDAPLPYNFSPSALRTHTAAHRGKHGGVSTSP